MFDAEKISITDKPKPKKRAWMEADEEPATAEEAEIEEQSDDPMSTLVAAMEDLDAAAGDPVARAKAFKAAFLACEAMPHDEAE